MNWFDDIERTNPYPGPFREGSFDFLNRVAGDYWDQVRNLGNKWVHNYPATESTELLQRLRSNRLGQFHPAYWELFLHEYFARCGFSVEVHPEVDESSARPDFYVQGTDGEFFVETVTVTSGRPHRQSSTVGQIYDAIDERVEDPRFCLHLRDVEVGKNAPPLVQFVRPLQKWLNSLDPDRFPYFGRFNELYEDEVVTTIRYDDWTLTVEAISLPRDHKYSHGHRNICLFPSMGYVVNDYIKIRAKLEEKSKKYGEMGKPFVLALQNMLIGSIGDDWQVLRSLFGDTSRGASSLRQGELDESYDFSFESLWVSKDGPRNSNVSGIIFAGTVHPETVARTELTWVANPWSKYRFDFPIPVRYLSVQHDSGEILEIPAMVATHEMLMLDKDWPHGTRFPRSAIN